VGECFFLGRPVSKAVILLCVCVLACVHVGVCTVSIVMSSVIGS